MLQQLLSMSPATGEEVKVWPIVVGAVAAVLVIVLVVLPLFGKNKKKK